MNIPLHPPTPARLIAGWAVRWDDQAIINRNRHGEHLERIRRGAFLDTIADGEIEFWINHERVHGIVASQADGTLSLEEDAIGLWIEAHIAETLAGDTALDMARGGSRGCSVGMSIYADKWSEVDGRKLRTITKAGLREISICQRGAYPSSLLGAGRYRIEQLKLERRRLRLALLEAELAA